MPELTLFSVFLVGLFGGLHCAGMCGGIVAVLGTAARGRTAAPSSEAPLSQAPAPEARAHSRTIPIRAAAPPLARLLGYNIGRISSYVAAGAFAGALGSTAALFGGLLPLQQAAFVATNLLLVAIGLYLTGVLGSLAFLERAGGGLWKRLAPAASRLLAERRWWAPVAAGVVWGWVPCGMVYGVLVAALMAGNASQGAALMLAFGLGTLPNLLALGWTAHALRGWLVRRGVRIAAGLVVIGFGLAGFARIDPTRHLHRLVDACLTLF